MLTISGFCLQSGFRNVTKVVIKRLHAAKLSIITSVTTLVFVLWVHKKMHHIKTAYHHANSAKSYNYTLCF